MEIRRSEDVALWRVWGFTSVIFQQGDVVAFFMGLLSLVPQVLIVACIAVDLTAFHRRFVAIHVGLALNEVINFALKQFFAENRPAHPCPFASRADFGFPSSHAQFMFFFSTQTALLLMSNGSSKAPSGEVERRRWRRTNARRAVLALGLFVLSALVCVSRVWNFYHTVGQVTAGAAVGVVLGLLFEMIPVIRQGVIERAVCAIQSTKALRLWNEITGIYPQERS